MLNMIVAHCRNRGIGINNKLPWKLKKDLKVFKNLTVGNGNNTVIMGRKTWESLPIKPLPNRKNIVISNKLNFISDSVPVFNNLETAKSYAIRGGYKENWIIGGSELYKSALEELNLHEIFVTNIDKDIECDTFFPDLNKYNYFKIEEGGDNFENNMKFTYEIYVKNRAYSEELKAMASKDGEIKIVKTNNDKFKECREEEEVYQMYCM